MTSRPPLRLIAPGGMATAASLLLASCAGPGGFETADTDQSGTVSPAEFNRYMLEAIYTEVDRDGNAQVTFEEWQAANPSAEPAKFKAPDSNRDEVVTPAEVKAHFKKQGTMEDLFSQIDTDGDGSLTRVEVTAFKEKLASHSGTPLEKLSKSISADK